MHTVSVARQAMATRFEIVLHGENPVSLRAAGEEALDEIERIEARLSLYRSSSEIAHVNARAAREAVRVSPATFRLLEQAARLTTETEGAFDITIGPLMRCWGFVGAGGHVPEPAELAAARAAVGMRWVQLDPLQFTVRFLRDGVMLDLGAIGKGHAVGVAADILRDAGVTSALIHGGTSSIFAMGHPPGIEAWKIAIDRPPAGDGVSSQIPSPNAESGSAAPDLLAVVELCDEAFSVSAVWGKSFQADKKTMGHVIDPRTGEPAGRAILAAVALPAATETDAFSTALLTLGSNGVDILMRARPRARLLVAETNGSDVAVRAQGIEVIAR
ncbi:MAG: FAD:protein transferase [Verrucomicrobiota bacterium]